MTIPFDFYYWINLFGQHCIEMHLDRVRDLAAFSYVPADCQHLMSRGRPYGWVAERVFADYLRMGLPSDQWFQCLLNVDYEVLVYSSPVTTFQITTFN